MYRERYSILCLLYLWYMFIFIRFLIRFHICTSFSKYIVQSKILCTLLYYGKCSFFNYYDKISHTSFSKYIVQRKILCALFIILWYMFIFNNMTIFHILHFLSKKDTLMLIVCISLDVIFIHYYDVR